MTFPQRVPAIGGVGRSTAAAVLTAACLAAAGLCSPTQAATLEVGAGKTYAMPSDAAGAAHAGDRIVIAAGTYFDCAVLRANDLTIEGAGPEATIITDKACAGKGLLVADGNNITIRNLMLTRARVPDTNGAGIRAEGGDLTVEHVQFVNNQNGILSSDMPGKKVIVRDSTFIRNGTCELGPCAHGIYAGHIGLLRVERSKFFETKQAHSIKSRAFRTEVIGCDIADGPNGTSSYPIEVPNGGDLVVRDTRIQKGPNSGNHTAAIEIGAEGVTQPTPAIIIEHNTFLAEGDYNSYLVYNLTATEAELKGNVLQGNAKPLRGDGAVN